MTPSALETELKRGVIRPVYLVIGEERVLVDHVLHELRARCVEPATADFNLDRFTAGDASVDRVLSVVCTAPMFAPRRLVIVHQVERWEPPAGGAAVALDRLADYCTRAVDSTCLVLCSPKLDARRRLVTLAKKEGFVVACDPLAEAARREWAEARFTERGHRISPEALGNLIKVLPADLGTLQDAVERLSLFVGPDTRVEASHVSELIVRVTEANAFQLIAAITQRHLSEALRLLDEVYDSRDGGLRLLGLLAWSVRQVLRFDAELAAGNPFEQAAKSAGVPPFRAKEIARLSQTLGRARLSSWMERLASADVSLKSSRRDGRAVLEELLISLVGAS